METKVPIDVQVEFSIGVQVEVEFTIIDRETEKETESFPWMYKLTFPLMCRVRYLMMC